MSADADLFAGDDVDGPLTAFSEADTIRRHALESSDGKTYAELDRDDPVRQTVMTASFLRASLFTSVVSFGVAAFAAGMGLLMLVIGTVLLRLTSLRAGRGIEAAERAEPRARAPSAVRDDEVLLAGGLLGVAGERVGRERLGERDAGGCTCWRTSS